MICVLVWTWCTDRGGGLACSFYCVADACRESKKGENVPDVTRVYCSLNFGKIGRGGDDRARVCAGRRFRRWFAWI